MRLELVLILGFVVAASGTPANVVSADKAVGASAMSAAASALMTTQTIPGVAIDRAADGLFYVDAKAGYGDVRFLIDTGATHVVLSHADARRANGTAIAGSGGVIITAGGPAEVDWVVLESLEIHGRILRQVKAAVPHEDTGISLLGQNALAQFPALHINGDRLTFSS